MPELDNQYLDWLIEYLKGQREVNHEVMEPVDLERLDEILAILISEQEDRIAR